MKIDSSNTTKSFFKIGAGFLLLTLIQLSFMIVCVYVLQSIALLLLSAAFIIWFFAFSFHRFQSFSVSLGATLISLSMIEAAIPFFLTNNLALTKYDPNSDLFNGYFQRNDDIGWFAKEGIYTAGKLSASGHEVIYNVKYRIGQDGFRLTPSISKEKAAAYPDDLLRINFFGCSFMFGEGLNDDETIPFFVGKHLDSTHVKNFGFHGYGIHNALAIMQSNFNTNGSINVLLTAPWHATRSACKEKSTFGSPKYVFDGDKVTKNGICGDASNSLMSEILSRSNIYKIIAPIRSTAVNKDFELYLRLVEEMFEKSRSNNQTFLVAFIKVEKDYFARSDYTNEMIFSALSKTSDAIIDVTLANTAEDIDPSLYIHSLDRHPSAKANAERANAIIELIKLKNIIP